MHTTYIMNKCIIQAAIYGIVSIILLVELFVGMLERWIFFMTSAWNVSLYIISLVSVYFIYKIIQYLMIEILFNSYFRFLKLTIAQVCFGYFYFSSTKYMRARVCKIVTIKWKVWRFISYSRDVAITTCHWRTRINLSLLVSRWQPCNWRSVLLFLVKKNRDNVRLVVNTRVGR